MWSSDATARELFVPPAARAPRRLSYNAPPSVPTRNDTEVYINGTWEQDACNTHALCGVCLLADGTLDRYCEAYLFYYSFVGEAIVGAYCALRRAAPDRVRGAPSAGAVYEALVALVLEQDRVGPEARGRTDRDGAEDEPFPFPAANEKDASGTGKENAGTNERPWAEEWSAPDEDVFRGAEPRVTVDE